MQFDAYDALILRRVELESCELAWTAIVAARPIITCPPTLLVAQPGRLGAAPRVSTCLATIFPLYKDL